MEMGKQPTDGPTSPEFLPKLIMSFGLQQGLSKRDITNAMRDLMLDSKLRRVQIGTYSNRSARFGLVAHAQS
jgi:hypothetical protein